MFKSFLNYFNESNSHKENKGIDDHLMVISGLLVETASVDGTIDDSTFVSGIQYLVKAGIIQVG